mmetsp:Transcript_14637/g.47838  ORF Transcript_14637/g.47838 Transcript_14637/m.47838 type:complete len:208 (-) Transcript_14637:1118-1741(-)
MLVDPSALARTYCTPLDLPAGRCAGRAPGIRIWFGTAPTLQTSASWLISWPIRPRSSSDSASSCARASVTEASRVRPSPNRAVAMIKPTSASETSSAPAMDSRRAASRAKWDEPLCMAARISTSASSARREALSAIPRLKWAPAAGAIRRSRSSVRGWSSSTVRKLASASTSRPRLSSVTPRLFQNKIASGSIWTALRKWARASSYL